MNILVTGAGGFVGSTLINTLSRIDSLNLTCALNVGGKSNISFSHKTYELDLNSDWSEAMNDQNVVVHTAARVHIMKDSHLDPLSEYRKVNVEGTLNIAKYALRSKVDRFIYISSIKVNGENTNARGPFTEDDYPDPQDPYAVSKLEAEEALKEIFKNTNMELVIIRPSLVYGLRGKGNLQLLAEAIKRRFPLPLKSINNSRSFISIDNLVDLIAICITSPAAKNEVFLASDNEKLSTHDLIKVISSALGKSAICFPFPRLGLVFAGKVLKKSDLVDRVIGSLEINNSKAKELLSWNPKVNSHKGIYECFKE